MTEDTPTFLADDQRLMLYQMAAREIERRRDPMRLGVQLPHSVEVAQMMIVNRLDDLMDATFQQEGERRIRQSELDLEQIDTGIALIDAEMSALFIAQAKDGGEPYDWRGNRGMTDIVRRQEESPWEEFGEVRAFLNDIRFTLLGWHIDLHEVEEEA